jgi:zinc transporter ZupT
MTIAVLLTGLALLGVAGGVLLHRSLSKYLAAAGGVLLFAVALIWLMPEISDAWGWPLAIFRVAIVVILLGLADSTLVHFGHSPRHHGVIAPLLAATAIHSVLDGWSIRALASQPMPVALVPIGLGLHKIPEGFALGWVLRRSLDSHLRAFGFGAFAELFTVIGALLQPATNRFGLAQFGPGWTPFVLCVIVGAFIFLGLHAFLPYFRSEH